MRWMKAYAGLWLLVSTVSGCNGDDEGSGAPGSGGPGSTGAGGSGTVTATNGGSTASMTTAAATASQSSAGGASSTSGTVNGSGGSSATGGSAGADTSTEGSSGSSTTGQPEACYSPTQNPELSEDEGNVGCPCTEDDAPECVDDRRFECQEQVWVRVGDGPCDETGPCSELVGQQYSSVEELECGNTPEGPAYCHWTLSFEEATYQWMRSDAALAGSYDCEGGMITAEAGAASFTGELHADGSLTWDGEQYLPESD